MWHELNTSYSGVLQQMKTASDPAQAAAIWDGQYEVSSGSSRQARIQNAVNFANSGLKAGAGVESAASMNAAPLNASSASGTPTQTPEERQTALESQLGSLSALLGTVPELKTLLSEAVSKGWTAPEFQNAVTNSQWYKTHSDAVRQNLVLQVSDPSTYKQNLATAAQKVSNLMSQMGISTVGMSNAQYVALSKQVMMGTISDQELQKNLAGYFGSGTGAQGQNYKPGMATGQAATYDTQLRELYAQYGQTAQPGQMAYRVRQMLAGGATIDQYKQQAVTAAKAMYPGLSSSIDQGMTVKDLAQPYIQSMSNLLEMDPTSISLNDRMVKSAMQGTGTVAKGAQPTATPIWQFEQQVRSDPRWQMTNNAKAATAATLTQLGKDWGFAS
jgi:hypothetical protein